uniref:Pentacotripeptide-repeat region of PRORP domain-containing protein n=2 Tax=Vannella robusta TaxID=1487602 RepID=A0A7S4M4D6_9EUKA|mmetsp:Transcript_10998/g.13578  ORF Transcript_10998/g.13578 Transcript_10998/m.13578 type:complete len:500 (+) Transcript_10998:202-1701(+)
MIKRSLLKKAEIAEKIFASIPQDRIKPTCKTWTLLIQANVNDRNITRALQLTDLMKENNIPPNAYTYNCLLLGYIKQRKFHMIQVIKEKMKEEKIPFGVISYSILIKGYMDCRMIAKAEETLQELHQNGMQANRVTYTSMISGYIKGGRLDKALKLFDQMGELKDTFVYNALIDGLMKKKEFDKASQLIDQMKLRGLSPDIDTMTSVISGYVKHGRVKDAAELLEKTKSTMKPATWMYTSIIGGFANQGHFEKAKEYVNELIEVCGASVAAPGFNAILAACIRNNRFHLATDLLEDMELQNVPHDEITYNTLIFGFVKTKQPELALECLESLRASPFRISLQAFTPIMDYYLKQNRLSAAMKLLQEVIGEGLVPDQYIFVRLTQACWREGNVNILDQLLYNMEKFSVPYNHSICEAIMRTCARGKVDSNTVLSYFRSFPSNLKFTSDFVLFVTEILTKHSDTASLTNFVRLLKDSPQCPKDVRVAVEEHTKAQCGDKES